MGKPMKIAICIVISLILMVSIPTITLAGEDGVNTVNRAKVARIKAKQRALARKNGTSGSAANSADGCGNINIGNVVNEKGSTGAREITVVIDGDVISTNNNCK
jgi:archaellum component FlaF (FlaF/FlaG flagellin family)